MGVSTHVEKWMDPAWPGPGVPRPMDGPNLAGSHLMGRGCGCAKPKLGCGLVEAFISTWISSLVGWANLAKRMDPARPGPTSWGVGLVAGPNQN